MTGMTISVEGLEKRSQKGEVLLRAHSAVLICIYDSQLILLHDMIKRPFKCCGTEASPFLP